MLFRKVAIVGVGLIGGSLGAALKDRKAAGEVTGIGYRTATLEQAREMGCVDGITTDLAAGVQGADLVVLATPVRLIAQKAAELAGSVSPGCIITDVGSTKKLIAEQLDELFAGRYVGSHPMAGSEKHGAAHASRDLFKGALCILTPTARTGSDALRRVAELWQALGSTTCEMPPAEHDRRVALASHLIHVAAACIVNVQTDASLQCASSGFADTTRIAGSDPYIWRDICIDNAPEIAAALAKLCGELDEFRTLVQKGDMDGLFQKLAAASQTRQAWAARRTEPAKE